MTIYKKKDKYQKRLLESFVEIGTGYFIWNNKKFYIKSYKKLENKHCIFFCRNYCRYKTYCDNNKDFNEFCLQLNEDDITVETGYIGDNSSDEPILISRIENL